MKNRLWTRNFTLLIAASGLGAVGGIAGGFAMSFLVFDETGSTLASALVLATELIPGFLLPLFIAPWMDRMPRKPFLIGGDMLNGVMYLLLGAYLLRGTFSYVGYLAFSLVLASLRAFDELAYNSIFPMLLPEGAEQKGYAVASTLYPVLRVMMLPLSAVLLDAVGAAWLLVGQGVLSLMASAVESGIRIHEERRPPEENSSLRAWWADVKEAARYLRQEKGLMNIYGYMAVTNGVASGYSPHSGGVLPDVSRHDGGHVLSVLRGGVPGPHSGRLCAVPDGDPGKEAVRLRLPGVHGVRGHGHAAALAAVSPDAGQPGPVRIFGDQQRHHAPGGGAAVYSGKAPGPGQRL